MSFRCLKNCSPAFLRNAIGGLFEFDDFAKKRFAIARMDVSAEIAAHLAVIGTEHMENTDIRVHPLRGPNRMIINAGSVNGTIGTREYCRHSRISFQLGG